MFLEVCARNNQNSKYTVQNIITTKSSKKVFKGKWNIPTIMPNRD